MDLAKAIVKTNQRNHRITKIVRTSLAEKRSLPGKPHISLRLSPGEMCRFNSAEKRAERKQRLGARDRPREGRASVGLLELPRSPRPRSWKGGACRKVRGKQHDFPWRRLLILKQRLYRDRRQETKQKMADPSEQQRSALAALWCWGNEG